MSPPPVPPVDRPAAAPSSRTQTNPPRLPVPVGCRQVAVLPPDHLDLLDAPMVAALATRLPGGFPQTQPVWYARDGNDTRHTHYCGEIYPLDQRNLETRIIARLHPRAVHCNAIHR